MLPAPTTASFPLLLFCACCSRNYKHYYQLLDDAAQWCEGDPPTPLGIAWPLGQRSRPIKDPLPRQASCFLASLTSFLLYDLLSLRSRSPRGYRCAQGDKSRMSDTQTRKEALEFQRRGFSKYFGNKGRYFKARSFKSKDVRNDHFIVHSIRHNSLPSYYLNTFSGNKRKIYIGPLCCTSCSSLPKTTVCLTCLMQHK